MDRPFTNTTTLTVAVSEFSSYLKLFMESNLTAPLTPLKVLLDSILQSEGKPPGSTSLLASSYFPSEINCTYSRTAASGVRSVRSELIALTETTPTISASTTASAAARQSFALLVNGLREAAAGLAGAPFGTPSCLRPPGETLKPSVWLLFPEVIIKTSSLLDQ